MVSGTRLRYVISLEVCPFVVMLCLLELEKKKKVTFLPEGEKEKTMYFRGVGDHNRQRRAFSQSVTETLG